MHAEVSRDVRDFMRQGAGSSGRALCGMRREAGDGGRAKEGLRRVTEEGGGDTLLGPFRLYCRKIILVDGTWILWSRFSFFGFILSAIYSWDGYYRSGFGVRGIFRTGK